MQVQRPLDLGAFFLLLLALVSPCAAQVQSFRPSEAGPISTLNRTLGNLSTSGPNLPSAARAANVSTLSAPVPPPRRNSRAGGIDSFSRSRMQSSSTGNLLGRHASRSSYLLGMPSMNSPSYPQVSLSDTTLLMRQPSLGGEEGFSAVGRHDGAASRPSDFLAAPRTPVSVTDLARDYINRHRAAYMRQGWDRYAEKKYREAGDFFELAESVCGDDLAARVEVEVAIITAAIASKQYSVASNALQWLLTPNRQIGDLPDPVFVTRFKDLSEHSQAVETLAIANPDSLQYLMLRSIVLWGRGDRAGALFYARSLTGKQAVQPWLMLAPVMERAQRSAPAAAAASSQPASGALLTADQLIVQ